MKNNLITPVNEGVYIIADNKFYSIEEWKKGADPTRADCIAIKFGQTSLLISKFDKADAAFNDAQKIAATDNLCDITCRNASRHEAIDIYNARFEGADDAMKLIGGDSLTDIYWTCDEDPCPEYSSPSAFIYNGNCGNVYCSYKYATNNVRPVAAF